MRSELRALVAGVRRGRAGLAGLLVLGMLACAAPDRPLEIVPHLPLLPDGDAERPDLGLGVGPFRDLRSPLSRRRQRPPFGLSWIGVRRAGENSTGDASFLGDVAEGARRDAARTLRYARLFGEVRLVPSEEIPPDLDFVLTGEIEELVGFQYQLWEIGILQAIGWRSRFDDPIGTARVRFRLLGPRGEVWQERIETRLQTTGLSMEQLALDALAASHERLVIALRRELVPSGVADRRSIPLRVLDACGLGRKRAARLIDDVNEIFEREAGLRFRPTVESWVPPRSGGPTEVLASAGELAPPPGGVVLAMAPADRSVGSLIERERSGLARQLGRHAVVICAGVEPKIVTLSHELAHLFGGVHATHRGSIMYPVADFEARFFDTANRRILRVARSRPLDGKLPVALVGSLREIYAEISQEPLRIEAESLEMATRALR